VIGLTLNSDRLDHHSAINDLATGAVLTDAFLGHLLQMLKTTVSIVFTCILALNLVSTACLIEFILSSTPTLDHASSITFIQLCVPISEMTTITCYGIVFARTTPLMHYQANDYEEYELEINGALCYSTSFGSIDLSVPVIKG
jgi:hypothetical protein